LGIEYVVELSGAGSNNPRVKGGNQMYNKELLLSSLKSCIVSFGDKYRQKADDYFWNEHDVACGLMNHLWKQKDFVHEFDHPLGNGKVPLVHAEHLNIDLCLYDADTAVEAVRDHAYDGFWWGNIKMLAAVQIEASCEVGKMRRECEKEVAPLLKHKDQIEEAYLVVFAGIQLLENRRPVDYTMQYQRLLEFLREKHKNQWNSIKLSIYCVPAYSVPFRPSKQIEPEWIR